MFKKFREKNGISLVDGYMEPLMMALSGKVIRLRGLTVRSRFFGVVMVGQRQETTLEDAECDCPSCRGEECPDIGLVM